MVPKHLVRDEPLAKHTTLGVGGPAKLFVVAQDLPELGQALDLARTEGLPHVVLGAGSNVLCSDAGFPGLVVRLGKGFERVVVHGERLVAGAASRFSSLAVLAQQYGLIGLSFAVGIPGTLGGAVVGNAGAFNRSVGDVVETVDLYQSGPEAEVVEAARITFGYRECVLPRAGVVVGAGLKLAQGDRAEVAQEMEDFRVRRRLSQPVGEKSAGSIFRNPDGEAAGVLIERAGCKGLSVGDAAVSEKHANFMVNRGRARAQDVYELMMNVRDQVQRVCGVTLTPEIRLVGGF